MTLFWLWSPHVIWKFVPDPRTNLWKGSLTKGFCFDGGYTNSAVVTGRKELPRWCVNPEPRGANAQWVWCDLTWNLWLLVLQLHFWLSKVYSECTTVHQTAKPHSGPIWKVWRHKWVFLWYRRLRPDKSNEFIEVQYTLHCKYLSLVDAESCHANIFGMVRKVGDSISCRYWLSNRSWVNWPFRPFRYNWHCFRLSVSQL